MIIPIDIKPEYSLYYNGAMVLDIIKRSSESELELMDLFNKTRQSHNITLQQYLFTLDWLYLIGLIESNKKGNVIKCF